MTEYYNIPCVRPKVYREPLRIGTAAKICRVSNKTMFNWISQGALKAFTTHGGHNRIWPCDLHAFLERSGIDVEFKFEDKRQTRFLIVNTMLRHRRLLLESFCDRFSDASIVATQSQYEALLLLGEQKPHVVTWDLNMPQCDAVRIIEFLKERNMNASIHVTLCHRGNHEEVKWHAYPKGPAQREKAGTGLTEMLNSLQELLVPTSQLSCKEAAGQAGDTLPWHRESKGPLDRSN